MKIYRAIADEENTWVHCSVVQNPNLSHEAIGLLLCLLSDGERFDTVADLVEEEGRGDFEIAEAAAQELVGEGHMRIGEPIEVWAVPFGWKLTESGTDEHGILTALAKAGAPMGMFDARDALLVRPGTTNARRREHREWTQRSIEVVGAWLNLWKTGLIWESVEADGEHGSECEISEAGRAALAATTKEEA